MRHLLFGAATIVAAIGFCSGESPQPGPSTTFSKNGPVAATDAATVAATDAPTARRTTRSPYLRVQDGRFIDAEGRQVLLHGLNVVSKSKDEGYLSWHRDRDFARMHAWGMNCVRLGIIWDGIEPAPGKYDEAYLDAVAQRVAWAGRHGLYVFLDMHQDLFSVLYGDGAPAWATLHEGQPHRRGTVWSDSYLISPAVQVSFDRFWANAPAPDGVGIQDHYAAAWRHVAERFADNPTVIGYDLMNEPFQGTSVLASYAQLLGGPFGTTLAQRLGDRVQSPLQLAELWKQPEGRALIMAHLEDLSLYRAYLDAQTGTSQAFERQYLQHMYQRVAGAIRAVDPHHILLLETSSPCNAGVASAIEPVAGLDGNRDAQQAYAPHAYDIVVDTPALASANTKRVELILARHGQTAKRLGMPMILGEWGAFDQADEQILPSALVLQQQIEKQLCGDTFWEYGRAVERRPYFKVLKRSIPSRIAGTLLEYTCDPATRQFTCRWQETPGVRAPTIVYLTVASFKDRTIQLAPRGTGFRVQPVADASGDVYLFIPPVGEKIERLLTVE